MEEQENKVYLAACAIYRNEARYLREWIEFHLLVGFERFYLYDNGSEDDHLRVLAPYIEEGIVVLEHWPIPRGQHFAYEDCLLQHRQEAHWIAFFDIDEFLFSPTGRSLPTIFGEFEGSPAVVVNIALFGTSGHEADPGGLVIEDYIFHAREDAQGTHVKCVVDPQYTWHCFGAHAFMYMGWVKEFRGATFDEPIWAPVDPVNERHERITIRHRTPELAYDLLRLNHYYTKSMEQYREKWSHRRSDTGEFRPPLSEQHIKGLSSELDQTIAMYIPALREAIDRRERE